MAGSELPHQESRWCCPSFLRSLASPKETVRQLTPSWYTVTMGTGITALVIKLFPYQFSGQDEIGWAVWWLNVIFFITLTLMFICRFIFFLPDALPLFTHQVQSLFLGAIPMGLATIINGITLFCIPRWGEPAAQLAFALYWVDALLAVLSGWVVPYLVFTKHKPHTTLESMTAVWLLPIVPGGVTATCGAILAPHVSLEEAKHLIIAGYVLIGMSIPLGLSMLVVYYERLQLHRLPPKQAIIASFLPVGPLGTGALALIKLGQAVLSLPHMDWGTPGMEALVAGAPALGILGGLVLWGYGLWWQVMAVVSVLPALRTLPFNLGWWGFIFPNGIFTAATAAIYDFTHMDAFKIMTAIFTCTVVLLWVVVMLLTLQGTWHGNLFHAPCLAERDAAAAAAAIAAEATPKEGEASAGEEGMVTELIKQGSGGLERSDATGAAASVVLSVGLAPGSLSVSRMRSIRSSE